MPILTKTITILYQVPANTPIDLQQLEVTHPAICKGEALIWTYDYNMKKMIEKLLGIINLMSDHVPPETGRIVTKLLTDLEELK